MKICKKCGLEKEDFDFFLHYGKRRATCKKCAKQVSEKYFQKRKKTIAYKEGLKKRREQNKKTGYYKKRYLVWGRNYTLKKKFGITEQDYKTMLIEQKGVCAICGCPETKIAQQNKTGEKKLRPLSVDHDHKTGNVRALLCDNCNNGLERFAENIEYLANAISYIEKHRQSQALMAGVGAG